MQFYCDLYKSFATGLVHHPSRLVADERPTRDDPGMIFVNVRCHPDDYGQLLGKAGRRINAFNMLFHRISKRRNQKVRVAIHEELGGARTGKPPDRPKLEHDADWDRDDEVAGLVNGYLKLMFDHPPALTVWSGGLTTTLTLKPLETFAEQYLLCFETILAGWGASQRRKIKIQLDK